MTKLMNTENAMWRKYMWNVFLLFLQFNTKDVNWSSVRTIYWLVAHFSRHVDVIQTTWTSRKYLGLCHFLKLLYGTSRDLTWLDIIFSWYKKAYLLFLVCISCESWFWVVILHAVPTFLILCIFATSCYYIPDSVCVLAMLVDLYLASILQFLGSDYWLYWLCFCLLCSQDNAIGTPRAGPLKKNDYVR